ncbi:hypothetical protein VE23_07860 [Paenibacillus sp. D9]|uniref:hypothetical protein n=1 Tax=Paenibacillus sp. D9 TaxID=665792 RepID=UPI00061E8F85|nr:hypothetical protein [Paenibacillus sp. D9]KKC47080.1 hypothetical protein VE23_07860 [Paenibacillus sp. D9]
MRNNRFFVTGYLVFSLILVVFFLFILIDIWWALNVPKTGPIGNGPPKMSAYAWIRLGTTGSLGLINLILALVLYRQLPPHSEEDPHRTEENGTDSKAG